MRLALSHLARHPPNGLKRTNRSADCRRSIRARGNDGLLSMLSHLHHMQHSAGAGMTVLSVQIVVQTAAAAPFQTGTFGSGCARQQKTRRSWCIGRLSRVVAQWLLKFLIGFQEFATL